MSLKMRLAGYAGVVLVIVSIGGLAYLACKNGKPSPFYWWPPSWWPPWWWPF